MSTQKTTWILELMDKITSPMKGVNDSTDKAKVGVDNLGKSLKNVSAMDLRAISESVQDVEKVLDDVSEPGIKFDSAMKDIEAITGVTGNALDELGKKARATAKDFGGDASGMLESYKGVLSRLGPDIAKNQDALNQMGVSIATLSKTMDNDAVGAMDALTTSVLQFGVDLSNPATAADNMTNMMNVMAAGAKEGASEVTQISEALKQAGVQALNSNVSFEQTNSALQALAQGGKFGSEAGVALRNVLGKMAGIDIVPKEAADKLKKLGVNYDIVSNKALPFTTRLRELSKAQADSTLIAQIFGVENAAAAQILLRSADYQDNLTQKITGTNTAVEQANIVMGSYTERVAKMKAWFSDLGISIFGVTQHILPFVDGLASSVVIMANMANAGKGLALLFNTFKIGTLLVNLNHAALVAYAVITDIVTGQVTIATVATAAWNAVLALNPIVWVVAGIGLLIAGLVSAYNHFGVFRGIVDGAWESIKGFGNVVMNFIVDVLGSLFKSLGHAGEALWKLVTLDFKGAMNAGKEAAKEFLLIDASNNAINNAKQAGKDIATAYHKGVAEIDGNKSKEVDATTGAARYTSATDLNKPITPVIKPVNLSSSKDKAGLSGSGGVTGSRTITQKIDIKNYFTVSEGSNVEAIAEKVVRVINDRLRDATVALQ